MLGSAEPFSYIKPYSDVSDLPDAPSRLSLSAVQ